MKNEILRLDRVTQLEGETVLLDDFHLHLFGGEIMGLVCINAHGKEALVEIICQNVPIHYGYIYFNENLVNNFVHSSLSLNRVAVIEQRSRLIEDLTVADNIFVLRRGFKKYLINPKVLASQLRLFTEGLDLDFSAGELVANLSAYEKCVVELLRAVVSGVKLVVLRDISNFIGAADLIRFHALLRRYAAQGMSFLYICSHHEETFKICDRIALMEDGKIRKVIDRENFSEETVQKFAHDFYLNSPTATPPPATPQVLEFCAVAGGSLRGMTFSVARGECVVLLDTDHSALADILQLMGNSKLPRAGEIRIGGKSWRDNRQKLGKELCFIGENPVQTALFHEMNYLDNLCFWLERKQPLFWMRPSLRKSVAREYEPVLGEDLYAADINGLSLTSLYNLIYYKVALYRPKVLFLSQPFSGADLYLRRQIIHLIEELKKHGIAVVILAVSVSDSLMIADRLLVLERGAIRRSYSSGEFTRYRDSL